MTSSSSPPAPWGTWDELLLAYAVNRYGTKNWDSISSELQKRTLDPTHITPLHCQQKYFELNRRFNHKNQNDVVMDDDDDNNNNNYNDDDDVVDEVTIDNNNDNNIPWLEDLRKQRVLELQTQLQNYDLYIRKLQSKVKKLTEEREKPLDLDNGIEPEKPEEEDDEKVPVKFPATEAVVSGEGERSGEDETVSDRDNQSVNGSNGNVNIETEGKPENGEEPGPGEEKGGPVKSEPGGGESTGVEKENVGMKENSDVQSSASKSKKEERGVDRIRRGSAIGKDEDRDEDEEEEDQSTDSIPVRSLPLVDFLARLHKVGSALFDRPRLDRQEKQRYKNLIRQHIDYEILQARLKEGWYSDGNDKFFRDLLLLVNNSCVFFPKESQESTAAMDLRQLILKEMMSKRKLKTDSKLMDKQTSLKLANLPSKRASEPPDSLLHKPNLAVPIVVCRKRSSITAKAAASSSGVDKPGVDKRKEQTDLKNSEKLNEEKRETPKRSRDSFPLITKKKVKSIEKNPGNETSNTKPDKKKKLTEAEEKKQSAAKFLNRMKGSNNEPLLNPLKSTSECGGSSENDGKGEHKKSGNKGGSEGKKDQASKKSSGGRQGKEQGSPAKRSVGRPPKRAAALSPMLRTLGKRNREPGDSETLVTKQTKKRSKR